MDVNFFTACGRFSKVQEDKWAGEMTGANPYQSPKPDTHQSQDTLPKWSRVQRLLPLTVLGLHSLIVIALAVAFYVWEGEKSLLALLYLCVMDIAWVWFYESVVFQLIKQEEWKYFVLSFFLGGGFYAGVTYVLCRLWLWMRR